MAGPHAGLADQPSPAHGRRHVDPGRSAATEGRLPTSAVAEIVQRADGLALYAEQLAATIVDAPGHQVPSTLQGILTAWLDRLAPELQLLLQRASAIGRVFEDAILGQIVDQGVDLESSARRIGGLGRPGSASRGSA